MEVIVIFDKYGYGGMRTLMDVVQIPLGSTDIDTFETWVKDKPSKDSYAYQSADVLELQCK